jgi:hypothetical protein
MFPPEIPPHTAKENPVRGEGDNNRASIWQLSANRPRWSGPGSRGSPRSGMVVSGGEL